MYIVASSELKIEEGNMEYGDFENCNIDTNLISKI